MNKLKKSLSVFLSLVMLFTTLCFFAIPETGIIANAANNVDGAVIAVPETVYMTPSTGASTTAQYYINNTVASGSYDIALEVNRSNENGYIQMYIPGAKSFKVAVNAVKGNTGDIVLAGITENTSYSFNANGYYAYNTAKLSISGTGLSSASTALAEWVFTVTMNDGTERTYYAYTTLYAPYYQTVGAALAYRAMATLDSNKVWLRYVSWVSGIHSFLKTPYKDSGHTTDYGTPSHTNTEYVANSSKLMPLLNNGAVTASSNGEQSVTDWLTSSSTGTFRYSYGEGDKQHYKVNEVSPTAIITVDTSRYSNFKEIPNFTVGMLVTSVQRAAESSWYIADYTNVNNNKIGSNNSEDWWDISTYFKGNSDAGGTGNYRGAQYNGVFDRKITSDITRYVVRATAYSEASSGRSVTGALNVLIDTVQVSKSTLRNLVIQGTSLNEKNYTTDSWTKYRNALRDAALALGNPANSSVATTALENAVKALQTTVTLNAQGGTIASSAVPVTVGTETTYTFNLGDHIPTRTGYTFKGWATNSAAESGSTDTVTLSFNPTFYATWKANTYGIAYENIFNLYGWYNSKYSAQLNNPGYATLNVDLAAATVEVVGGLNTTIDSDIYTVHDGPKDGFYNMMLEPNSNYALYYDVEHNGKGTYQIYAFPYDAQGNKSDFNGVAWGNTAHDQSTEEGSRILTFSTGNDMRYAEIRFGIRGKESSVKFSNIRLVKIPDGYTAESYREYLKAYSYYTSFVYNDNATYGSTILDAPGRIGYKFLGWYTADGTQFTADMPVRAEHINLFSKWKIKQSTIKFMLDGTTVYKEFTGNFGDVVPAVSAPTKEGHTFVNWDKSIPSVFGETDITINAVWNINKYTVSFDSDGGTSYNPIQITYGNEINLDSYTPIKAGYTFAGWENADGYKSGDAMPAKDITFEAKWTTNSYIVRFDANGGAGTMNDITVSYENSTVKFPANGFTSEASHFEGWNTRSDGTGTSYSPDALIEKLTTENGGIVTLYAIWEEHNLVEDYNKKVEPTCTAPGETHKYCTVCAAEKTEAIPALGHSIVEIAAMEPTCTEDGRTAGQYCTRGCTDVKIESTKIDKLDHKLENGDSACTILISETINCLTSCSATYKCSLCNEHTVTITSAPAGHKFKEELVAEKMDPTCTAGGFSSDVYECERCKLYFATNDKFAEEGKASISSFEIPASGHIKTEHPAVASTCTVAGNIHYWSCSVCNKCFTDIECQTEIEKADTVLPLAAHTEYTWTTNSTATCEQEGTYDLITSCSVCNEQLKKETVVGQKLPHAYKEKLIPNEDGGYTNRYSAATCTSPAKYSMVCKDCGDVAKDGINVFTIDNILNPDNHPKDENEQYVTEIRGYADPTCYAPGYTGDKCYVCCGAVAEKGNPIDKIAHTKGDATPVIIKQATCYETGLYKNVYYCTVCAAHGFTNVEIPEYTEPNQVIDMVAHTAGTPVELVKTQPTCYSTGVCDIITYCRVCQAAGKGNVVMESKLDVTMDMLSHIEDSVATEEIITPATCYADGSMRKVVYCATCKTTDNPYIFTDKTEIVTIRKETVAHTPGDEVEIDRRDATCYAPGYYYLVAYCTECEAHDHHNVVVSSTKVDIPQLTHEAAENATIEVIKAATCTEKGSYNSVVYCKHCGIYKFSVETLTEDEIPHEKGEKFEIENIVYPTDTEDGSHDEVYYCHMCNKVKVDTVHVIDRVYRTITFKLKNETITYELFNGDTVTVPAVPDYETEEFIYKHTGWDKAVVITVHGSAAYEAVYTSPCEYGEFDRLSGILDSVIEDKLVEESVLERHKLEIDAIYSTIAAIEELRKIRDKAEQYIINELCDRIEALFELIYPDAGSYLEIIDPKAEGGIAPSYGVGTILDLHVMKMPAGNEITGFVWISSDESIIMVTDGKLYAVGTGTVTIKAVKGNLTAERTIRIVAGAARVIMFDCEIYDVHYAIESGRIITETTNIFWSPYAPISFRVLDSGYFLDYIVYVNDVVVTPDADGDYVIPANTGDAHVRIEGLAEDPGDLSGSGEKVSIWDMIRNFFKRIGDFFRNLFN